MSDDGHGAEVYALAINYHFIGLYAGSCLPIRSDPSPGIIYAISEGGRQVRGRGRVVAGKQANQQ